MRLPDDPEYVCARAPLELQLHSDALAHSITEHGLFIRWEMASLLAINAGALVALINSSELPSRFAPWALCSFIAGLISAILISTFGQVVLQRHIDFRQRVIRFHIEEIASETAGDEPDLYQSREVKNASKLNWIYYPLVASSLLFFAIGCGLTAFSLNSKTENVANTTLSHSATLTSQPLQEIAKE